jgi:hypothetical protein
VRVVAQVARAEQPLVVAVEEQLWVQPQLVVRVVRVVAQVARAEQPLVVAV